MERINKIYIILGLFIAFGFFFAIAANADELNQATRITFSAPVAIPGQVLPAGTYLFKLANTEDGRNVVQVYNADGNILYATLLTIPTERQEQADHTVVTFAEQSNAPDALLKWFYPGNVTGNEFVWPGEAIELAHDVHQSVAVHSNAAKSEAQAAS